VSVGGWVRCTSFALVVLLSSGCVAYRSSSEEERYQVELSLHRVRTEMEDMKHDLNSYDMDHQVLESKILSQEQRIEDLKQQVSSYVGQLNRLMQDFKQVELSLQHSEKKQEERVTSEIRQLSHSLTTSLAQQKEKVASLEQRVRQLEEQDRKLGGGKTLTQASGQEGRIYVVKPGDSLEKIAREHGVTVEQLKQHNGLMTDLIVVDQELRLP